MHFCLCDFALDLVQNSVEAGARWIELELADGEGAFRFTIADDGKGMGPEELERAKDPFYSDGVKHARRRVGLGIPFLLQALEQVGGSYTIDSEKGKGTRISYAFPARHPDTPPLGDVPGLAISAMAFEGDYELLFRRRGAMSAYEASRHELDEAVGGIGTVAGLLLARDFLESQEAVGA